MRQHLLSAFHPARCACALIMAVSPLAISADNSQSLTILSLGGDYQKAQSSIWFQPFAHASGITVKEGAGYNYAKLKVMIQSGNVEADIIDVSADTVAALNKDGLLEKIDWAAIPQDCQHGLPADMKKETAFPTIQWAMVMAYNSKTFPDGKGPKSWQDFWNTQSFPGKRGSIGATRPPVEQAALAENPDMAKLYPIDLKKAYEKIRQLGDQFVFSEGYAQVAQNLASGETDMAILPNGRVTPLINNGVPVVINWNQHLRFPSFFVIPKGAPNKQNAMKFLAWVCHPNVIAQIAKPTSYGPINTDAYQFIAAEVAATLPGNPKTADLGRTADTEWLSNARPQIARRWASLSLQ
ncbi:hypothetical protein BTJ39_02475 [Izhakiella australiensis]|uniref:ABC transporter substrate-binding protein n=1 Tax=Izhakiella australiensis TaxID=1926881 RepID=A0A1S8YSI5_9GAMM|nr:ABC transporter substrate-binding protein [Izhakiella australiensis]OON42040.1 hypothetical protein BTJ39_02475 [Izhakiella australiensis]